MSLVNKWQDKFQLTDWEFTSQEIKPEQVVYDEDCPDEDKYFVGIEIGHIKKTGIIYYDRAITEEDIIHELLHVKYPDWSEDQVNEETEILLNKSR
tara:strand:- start:326 stop:613 length:288 start_codon:yes stop_codon:yes gene_type:complete